MALKKRTVKRIMEVSQLDLPGGWYDLELIDALSSRADGGTGPIARNPRTIRSLRLLSGNGLAVESSPGGWQATEKLLVILKNKGGLGW
jgi:hypothetical protein